MRAADWLRLVGKDSLTTTQGKRSSTRGFDWPSNRDQPGLPTENHTAEGMANGEVGSLNPCERYAGRLRTLTEQPIPGGRAARGDAAVQQRGLLL
jgi:hypothetical protein